MKGDKIPDDHNIARLCKPMQTPNGVIQASAFLLRDNEKCLSVNWLEFLNRADRNREIIELRRIYSETFNRVSENYRIAILKVGAICDIVRTNTLDNRVIDVLHDPIPDGDQSHSGIYNLRQDDQFIAELLLEVVSESHQAC